MGEKMTGVKPLRADLTNKERIVLALVAEGFDNIGIASIMGIKKTSVRVHIKNIYPILGYLNVAGDLSSRYDLIVRARLMQEVKR